MTIGDLLAALETDIFEKDSKDPFVAKCREREEGIRNYMNICGVIVHQHVTKPYIKGGLAYWKKEKIKKNILTLTKYTEELYHELNRENIVAYIKKRQSSFMPFISTFDPDITLIILHSYYGTIITDIHWITDLSFGYAFKISAGQLDLELLGKELPGRVEDIKIFLKKNRDSFSEYDDYFKIVEEALKCYELGLKKALNLLAITSTEALVRKFGEYLIQKQELLVDLESDKYNSIDTFLRLIPWKYDLEYTKSFVYLITSTTDRYDEEEEAQTIREEDSFVEGKKLNYKMRLDFLRRRFKENRDIIVHGQETEYDKDWQSYINLSALYEVLKTMKEYKDIYK
jgi:hypothetical protein